MERQKFEEWCGITITDESKAPKAAALKRAYWSAWQASRQATAREIVGKLRWSVSGHFQHSRTKHAVEKLADEIEREFGLKEE